MDLQAEAIVDVDQDIFVIEDVYRVRAEAWIGRRRDLYPISPRSSQRTKAIYTGLRSPLHSAHGPASKLVANSRYEPRQSGEAAIPILLMTASGNRTRDRCRGTTVVRSHAELGPGLRPPRPRRRSAARAATDGGSSDVNICREESRGSVRTWRDILLQQ